MARGRRDNGFITLDNQYLYSFTNYLTIYILDPGAIARGTIGNALKRRV